MAMQNHHTQTTYTIEQIELIRRLRNSGLTKEQVVQAYESFERVDTELGNLYTVPHYLTHHKSFPATVAQNNPSRNLSTQAASLTSQSPSAATTSTGRPPSPVPVATPVHVNRRFQGIRRSRDLSTDSGGVLEVSSGDIVSVSTQDAFPKAKVMKLENSYSNSDMSERVEDFLSQGTEKMYEEIREFFVANPNFTPNDMASSAGVGVTCVSKFLVGNLSALSPQVLRLLCEWFLTTRIQHSQSQQQQQQQKEQILQQQSQRCTNSTSKMLRDIVNERLNGGLSPLEGGLTNGAVSADRSDIRAADILNGTVPIPIYPDGLDVQFTPRRERFTFRKKHLEVLEAYFKTNQYPTYEERTDIAQRCNDIMEVVAGRGLGEKERMTPQNVAYWFSNRRKDIKRIAREGGIDMSEVILPSRVRQSPPVMFPDSAQSAAAAAASWAVENCRVGFSLNTPSVGPVAFPTTRGAAETSSAVETASMSSDSQSGSDAGTSVMQIKPEPVFFDTPSIVSTGVTSPTVTSQGRGSAVNKIAADISSQLMSAVSSLTSASVNEATVESSAASEVTPSEATEQISAPDNENEEHGHSDLNAG